MRSVDVAILGAGTAGLSARQQVAKVTDNYLVIDDGPLGTTCARVGCMPSKVLIQVANDFHRAKGFARVGIHGAETLCVDRTDVMNHVRTLRDRFADGVKRAMEGWADKLVRKRAAFVDDLNTLELTGPGGDGGPERVRANRVIIAVGSTPFVPEPWRAQGDAVLDTDSFFELQTLPNRMAVIGLGIVGLELGQAIARLGVQTTGVSLNKAYGSLSDPTLQGLAHAVIESGMPVELSAVERMVRTDSGLEIELKNGKVIEADKALVAIGRRPNVSALGLEALGVPLRGGVPPFDPNTFRIPGTPLYLAGDANNDRPILHEAADEGRIAGYNAIRKDDECFQRRHALTVTFSEPNIAVVGKGHRALEESKQDFVTGKVSFEGQGRAIVKRTEQGALHVYADKGTGQILGAELIAPDGEHLAHLLSWAMSSRLSVQDILSLPFYHPVIEEGLRTALRDAARQTESPQPPLEVLRCIDPPAGTSVSPQPAR